MRGESTLSMPLSGITPLASDGKRASVEIRAENLNLRNELSSRRFFEKQDGERIHFLSSGAARRPDAYLSVSLSAFKQPRDDVFGECVERLRITEESGDRNKKVFEERLGFLNVVSKVGKIRRERVLARDLHTPGDATQNGRPLVQRKIVAEAQMKMSEDAPQRLLVAIDFRYRLRKIPAFLEQIDQLLDQISNGEYEIGDLRSDRASRHRSVFRLVWILHQNDAA